MNQTLPNGVYQFDHTVDSLCPMATQGLTGLMTNITAWGCESNSTQYVLCIQHRVRETPD